MRRTFRRMKEASRQGIRDPVLVIRSLGDLRAIMEFAISYDYGDRRALKKLFEERLEQKRELNKNIYGWIPRWWLFTIYNEIWELLDDDRMIDAYKYMVYM